MKKTPTACCALCQISDVNNDTKLNTLNQKILRLKKEKENNTEVGISFGNGQTAVFVIVSPGEYRLEENLQILKFEHVHTFERRVGYPPGLLKMYIRNL